MNADQVRNASFSVFFDTDVCPIGTPWAVKGAELGELKGCYASNEAAHAAATAFSELDQPGEVSSKTTNASREPMSLRHGTAEKRTITDTEIRENAAGGWTLYGYASTFSDPYKVRDQYGTFTEQIMPGAWDRSIQNRGHKIQLLDSHGGLPYASTKAGTLRVNADKHGLAYEADLSPRQQRAVDLADAVARGDVDEMSVGMRIPEGGDTWKGDLRSIGEATLMEISVVARGANSNTEAGMREEKVLAEIRRLETLLGGTIEPIEELDDSEAARRVRYIDNLSRLYKMRP